LLNSGTDLKRILVLLRSQVLVLLEKQVLVLLSVGDCADSGTALQTNSGTVVLSKRIALGLN
jgi:hypothetical protein